MASRRRRKNPANRRPPRRGEPSSRPGQVGRRPSSPLLLLTIAVIWIVCGVVALVRLHASWRIVPGVVFIGIGLFYLRAAAATTVRRDEKGR